MKLALYGGQPIRTKPFPAYNMIGEEEKAAANRVLDSGILSRFLGCWHQDFYGGPEVQALEKEWAEYYRVKHAISVNSATSGLYCAVGATGIGPGDEIIVSPYTMTASASAALIYNAIPVFADIEEDYFCLNPNSVESRISPRTKAIIVVDIFGQPYDVERINKISKTHNLIVIEDAAQAPGVRYRKKYAGTLGDIGIYSLNYHKHIHSGEGGVIVTNDDALAERMRLIRNHAEAVMEDIGQTHLANMLGFNYRMTEIEAAIAREQLKKLKSIMNNWQENVTYLEDKLSDIPCLQMPLVRPGCEHAYYVHALKFKRDIAGIDRECFVEAVKAELMPYINRETEGVKVGCGYVRPLYLQPLYQQKIVYGENGFPFNYTFYGEEVKYNRGLCPICEEMYYSKIITHELMRPSLSLGDLDDVAKAFKKVWKYREELKTKLE